MFAIAILIAFTLLLLALLWWYQKYWYFYSELEGIPGETTLPFIGTAFDVKHVADAYFVMDKHIRKYGTIIKECVGIVFALVAIDPEFIDQILTDKRALNKGRIYKFFHNWLGTGLLTSPGSKWKNRRKLLTPAYHFKILEQFIDVFDKNSDALVKKLKLNVKEQETDIHPIISLCTLDIILETAMGTSVNAQENEESSFVRATKEMNRIVLERLMNAFKHIDFLYHLTTDYQKELEALKVIHNYTLSIIRKRRKVLITEQTSENKTEAEDLGMKKRRPFLDLLLLSTIDGKALSDEDIKEEVNTFMFEGHDTTSSGISFCLYLISKNAYVQTKIVNEQREIFGNEPNRPTTYKDLQEMRYLEMVIKESLRLFPPVPVFSRIATEDFKINNWTIKKGLEIAISAYSLHRHPKFYENPEVFDPERFTPENQVARHPFSYIPFSAGYRNCIGQKFAMLELKSVIGKLVRNFKLLEVPDFEVKLKSEIILSSQNGVKIRIDNRVWS